jgi:GTP-binding protein
MADDVEFYGFTRAQRSIRRADVVLFFIDAVEPVGDVDKRLGGYIAEQFKPCILVINKWDLARERADTSQFGEYLTKVLPNLTYAPIAFVTASEARNVQSVLDLAKSLHKQATTRISTATFNGILEEITTLRGPSTRGTKRPKIYYGTQITVSPPTLVLFVNDTSLITAEYQRFLINRFQERLPFAEVPIRLLLRPRRGPAQAKGDSGHGARRPRSTPGRKRRNPHEH